MKTTALLVSTLSLLVACKKEPAKSGEMAKSVEATAAVAPAPPPVVPAKPAPAKASPAVEGAKSKLAELASATLQDLDALVDPTSGLGYADWSTLVGPTTMMCGTAQAEVKSELVAAAPVLKAALAANTVTCAPGTGAYIRCDVASDRDPQLLFVFEWALDNANLVAFVKGSKAKPITPQALAPFMAPQSCDGDGDKSGGPH